MFHVIRNRTTTYLRVMILFHKRHLIFQAQSVTTPAPKSIWYMVIPKYKRVNIILFKKNHFLFDGSKDMYEYLLKYAHGAFRFCQQDASTLQGLIHGQNSECRICESCICHNLLKTMHDIFKEWSQAWVQCHLCGLQSCRWFYFYKSESIWIVSFTKLT